MISKYNITFKEKQMRDIINLLDLTESVGLANRKPGTVFANPQGDALTFQGLTFYPTEGGRYNTPEEFQEALDQVAQALGIDPKTIVWTNPPQKGGFGIAQFTDAADQPKYFGRYFQKISPVLIQNNFPNQLPGNYRLQTNVAKKEAAGYKPTDVLTRLNNLTPADILAQIQTKFGQDSDEARATELFIAAKSFPVSIPLGNMNFTAFTNYFCEMLQPMALVLGKPTTGTAQQAADKFLTKGGYDTCKITFGASVSGGLTDSTLINPAGQVMGLSSKAEGGAKASAKNLMDKIREMKDDPDGQKLLKQYAKEISLLEVLTAGSTPGSLNGAVLAKIITPKEADQIIGLKNQREGAQIIGKGLLSPELEQKYAARKARDPAAVIPFYHIRAVIANELADWVNTQTGFGKAASAILNWGAFIQVYTHAKQNGENIVLNAFNVVFPSAAVTDVQLSADKTFYSTGSKGNFTFKILYNGATDVAEDVEEEVGAGSNTELTDLQTDHGVIPSNEPGVPEPPKNNLKKYGRPFQR